MRVVTIYHNPRCGKSRAALRLIEEAGVEAKVVRYLEEPPSAAALGKLLKLLGMKPSELIRTGEPIAKELGIGQRAYTDKQLIDLMAEHPILIERPIIVRGSRAVVGRPPERVKELL